MPRPAGAAGGAAAHLEGQADEEELKASRGGQFCKVEVFDDVHAPPREQDGMSRQGDSQTLIHISRQVPRRVVRAHRRDAVLRQIAQTPGDPWF